MSYVPEQPHELTTSVDALSPVWPSGIQEQALALMRSIVSREARGSLSAKSAQMLLQRLLPPLEPARVIPTVNLEGIPAPSSAEEYRGAMRYIFDAATHGRIGLDEARKAMILTKTLWRAELEVAALEARSDGK